MNGFVAGFVLSATLILTHDPSGDPNWIGEHGYKNTQGARCCGITDCERLRPTDIEIRKDGIWLARFRELVPYEQATPSEDGYSYRCQDNRGGRRCFFFRYGEM